MPDIRLSKELFQLRNSFILKGMKIISTAEAAKRLGVSATRVRVLIDTGRLKAIKIGGAWLIDPKGLAAVKDRKVGRPRKTRDSPKRNS